MSLNQVIIEVEEKFDQKYNHGLPPILKGNHDYVSSIAKVILFEGMFKRNLNREDVYKILYSINEKSKLREYIFPFESSKVQNSIQSKSLARMYDFYIEERKDEDSPLTALAKVGIRIKNQTLTEKYTEFKKDFTLFSGLKNKSHMYFVHSYELITKQKDCIAATTNYGNSIIVAVTKENIFGTQFHPEKSQKNGLKILENFLKWEL